MFNFLASQIPGPIYSTPASLGHASVTGMSIGNLQYICSDPSYESDPSNEYSPLGLTHVMNSIFLDPSNEFLTQAVNIGIPKQTLGLCFHVSK